MTGLLISLEGGEGAGKSTLLQGLRHWLADECGIQPLLTREPGGTPLGEAIRQVVLDAGQGQVSAEAELLLMFAARAQHVREVLVPALEAGRLILCDRFTDASYAYQGGGRGQPVERIAQLEAWAAAGLQPHLTLLIDLPPEVGHERIAGRGAGDRIEQEKARFFERVQAAYRARAEACPQRFHVLDGRASADDVLAQARPAVASALAAWRT